MASPLPHLLAHRHLQSLLLARASMQVERGVPERAERPLEASWALNGALVERPDLISRLLAVSIAGMQRGVLRTLAKPPATWPPRLREPYPLPLRISFQLEAWNWTRYTTGSWGIFDVSYMEDGVEPPRSAPGTAGRWLTAPYVRLSFAGVSEALLRESQRLDSERRCDFDVDRHAKEFEESFPRWNILGRIATPSLVRSWTAFRYAELDRELTSLVLAARGGHAATGRWPGAAVPSSTCQGVSWLHEPGGDGTLTIRSSEKPFARDDKDWHWSIRLHP